MRGERQKRCEANGRESARNVLKRNGRLSRQSGEICRWINVGHLILNQRVQGSSPCAPTSPIKGLGPTGFWHGKTGAPFRAPSIAGQSRDLGFALPATGQHHPTPSHDRRIQRPRHGLNFGRNLSKRDDGRGSPAQLHTADAFSRRRGDSRCNPLELLTTILV